MAYKRGRWSDEEKEFLRQNNGRMSITDISIALNRRPEAVQDYMKEVVGLVPPDPPPEAATPETVIREEFRQKRDWQKLREELTPEELAYFEEEYAEMVAQYKDDVLKTEQQQIRKAITIDILMRRNLVERKKLKGDLVRLEKMQERMAREFERDRPGMTQDQVVLGQQQLLDLEAQLGATRQAEQSKTKEYVDLDTKHQKLMNDMKSTRQQRIERVESGRQTILSLLRDLQNEEMREEKGRQIELMKKASAKEYERLAEPHVYEDGNEDLPLLTPETVEHVVQAGGEHGGDDESEEHSDVGVGSGA